MAKYVKLGPKAGGFSDPFSRFDINKGVIKELVTPQEKTSGRIRAAIRGGHLVVCTSKEYKEYMASLEPVEKPKKEEKKDPPPAEKYAGMTKEMLTQYYKDTYDVSEKDVTTFEKYKHEDMVAELLDLEDPEKE